jgi:hypothetical protein
MEIQRIRVSMAMKELHAELFKSLPDRKDLRNRMRALSDACEEMQEHLRQYCELSAADEQVVKNG